MPLRNSSRQTCSLTSSLGLGPFQGECSLIVSYALRSWPFQPLSPGRTTRVKAKAKAPEPCSPPHRPARLQLNPEPMHLGSSRTRKLPTGNHANTPISQCLVYIQTALPTSDGWILVLRRPVRHPRCSRLAPRFRPRLHSRIYLCL